MRDTLKAVEGRRVRVRATFERFGSKRGWQGREIKTVLLVKLTDVHGHALCDHLWFNLTQGFEALKLQPGDEVEFEGRVAGYWKGYRGQRDDEDLPPVSRDFKLSHPNHFRKLGEPGALETLPLFAMGD